MSSSSPMLQEGDGSGSVKAQPISDAAASECDGNDGDWTQLKSKKELRRERKKRNLLALSAVMMLNEQEGTSKPRRKQQNPSSSGTIHTDGDEPSPTALETEANNNLLQQNSFSGLTTVNVGDGELRKILANNRTAFNISEREQETPTVDVKRRKEESDGTVHDNAGGISAEGGTFEAPSQPLNSETEYRALKAYVNQRKNMRFTPRVLLKPIGQNALLDRNERMEARIPLLLDDIQALLMHTLLRTDSPVAPRWVTIDKNTKLTHTTVLIVEGFSCEDYVTYREHMPKCSNTIFGPQFTLQVVCPWSKILEEVACVPLSDTHKDILVAEYGSLEAAMRICKDQMLVRKSIFRNIQPAREPNYSDIHLPPGDNFPRTLLLLSPIQMINEGYPVPLAGTLQNKYKNYVTTSDFYKPVHPRSPMFGIDCEMCGIAGGKSVLTRISMVDEKGTIVYNKLVKPDKKIVDYRTPFSGITEAMLRNVKTTLADVQRDLRVLLPPDAILVGHSLNSDLDALEMLHPYVIDSSIVYNVTGNPVHKQKLRILTKKFLQQNIQSGTNGHCSLEDSAATLSLVRLKLANSIYFGDQWLEDRRDYHSFRTSTGRNGIAEEMMDDQAQTAGAQQPQITATLFSHAKKRNKVSVITTNADEELRTFEAYFGDAIPAHGKQTGGSQQQKWLSLCKTSSPVATIETTATNCLQYDFNLAYVRLPEEERATDDKPALAKQIDGWINRLYNALSLNGMLVVLLVGAEQPTQASTGNRIAVAMVQTKKPPK
uniref:Exonuclease domain-containing protein n=1 Tax=Anopheles minimus TaxID=112268 RepID=A0A182WLS4_9DIPT